MFDRRRPIPLTDVVSEDETFTNFSAMPSNQTNMAYMVRRSRRQTSLPQTSVSDHEAAVHYISLTVLDPWWSTFSPRRQQWTGTIQEQTGKGRGGCGQEQRPNVGTTKTFFLLTSAAPHKAMARVQYLEGQKLQALPLTLLHPYSAPRDCWLFSTMETGLARDKSELRSCVKVEVDVLGSPSLIVRTVPVDVTQHLRKKRWIQNFTPYLLRSTTTPSKDGRGDCSSVWTVTNSTLNILKSSLL